MLVFKNRFHIKREFPPCCSNVRFARGQKKFPIHPRRKHRGFLAVLYNLFFKTLNSLYGVSVLENIILIGSWCHYFSNAAEIPLLRTMDIDFLIPNPPKIQKEVNIPEILGNFRYI